MIFLSHRVNSKKNPVYRYLDQIKNELQKRGEQVTVLSLNSERSKKGDSLIVDLVIKNFYYLSYLSKLSFYLCFKIKKKDRLFITTDPPYFFFLIYIFSFFKKYRITIWWQDLFPETFFKNKFIIKIISYFRNDVIKNNKNIFISMDQYNYIKLKINKDIKYEIIYNWSNYELKDKSINNNSILNFAYTGNISISHNTINLLKQFKKIRRDFVFYISYNLRFKDFFETLKFDKRFKIIDYLSDNEYLKLLKKIDICIVTERANQNQYLFPSKFISYYNLGKFVLYYGNKDSSIDSIIKDSSNGFFIQTGDSIDQITFDKISKNYLNRNAKIKLNDHFNKKIMINKICKYII